MFKHLLFYNIKIITRNKEGLLWGLLFPLVYGLIYMFAFQGIAQETTQFDAIPVAIVYQGSVEEQASAEELMENISTEGSIEGEDIVESDELTSGEVETSDYPILAIETADIETALGYLTDGLISQAIYTNYDENGQLNFEFEVAPAATGDINSSIVYSILQYFASSTNAYTLLYENIGSLADPTAALEDIELRLSEIDSDQEFIVASNEATGVSSYSNFYYVALAYICIFFMSLGINLILNNEAKYSITALRETVTPSKKIMRFFVMLINWTIPALLVVYFLLGIYQLNDVPLGGEFGRIMGLMTIGPITGILLGSALAATFKVHEDVITSISIIVPLIFGALSGMMSNDVKVWIVNNVPILNKINPVALINDAFYYLNAYPTYQQFNQNISILIAISFVCLVVTLIGIRRTDYENL